MIVVDASVLVGLAFNRDAYHADALAARQRDPDWQAPTLIRSEIRNVGRGYLRNGEAFGTVGAAIKAGSSAVTSHAMGDDEVMQVVKDGHLTAYDAEYVALARRLGCRLVTTDTDILEHYSDESISLADFVA